MTSPVASLASHRRKKALADTCPRCRPEQTCLYHLLTELHARMDAARGTDLADEALADALAVLGSIIRPATARDERTSK